MSRTDLIADAMTMVRNASRIGKENVDLPNSKMIRSIADILKKHGYIKDWRLSEDKKQEKLRIYLQYDVNKKPAIKGLKKISKCGLRRYAKKDKIPLVLRGFGLAILSTSKGILTDKEARDLKIGGEVVCYVW